VRRWEYKKIALSEAPRRGDDIDLLCDAGEAGWELVSVLPNGVAYLKREVTDSVSEPAELPSYETEQREPNDAETTASNGGTAAHVKAKYRDPVTGETWC